MVLKEPWAIYLPSPPKKHSAHDLRGGGGVFRKGRTQVLPLRRVRKEKKTGMCLTAWWWLYGIFEKVQDLSPASSYFLYQGVNHRGQHTVGRDIPNPDFLRLPKHIFIAPCCHFFIQS